MHPHSVHHQRFDIAIIGGGVYGCAVAYYLSARTDRIALFERGAIGGEGATRYSGGIVRAYDPDPLLSAIGEVGARYLSDWRRRGLPGADPMHACGCLYLVAPEHAQEANAWVERHRQDEYPIESIAPRDLTRFGFLRSDHPGMGIFERRGGYGDPRLTTRNLAAGAQQNGALLFEHCAVRSIGRGADNLWSLEFEQGHVQCECLVVAGGAYAAELLPELPLSVQSIPLTQCHIKNQMVPFPVIDECSQTFLRPIGGGNVWCGGQARAVGNHPDKLAGYGRPQLEDAQRRAAMLLHCDAHIAPLTGVCGFDGYTRDYRPIIGFTDIAESLYVAAGFSGRGYKYVLPVAEAIANDILGRNTQLDLSAFRPKPLCAQIFATTAGN